MSKKRKRIKPGTSLRMVSVASIEELERMYGLMQWVQQTLLQKHFIDVPTLWKVTAKTSNSATIQVLHAFHKRPGAKCDHH
jgi:hypothetical protein